MRVKVGNSTSTCFHIRVSRECEIKSPSPHLANIDRRERSGKDYRALAKKNLSTPMCIINSRGDLRGDVFFRGARFIQRTIIQLKITLRARPALEIFSRFFVSLRNSECVI